MHGCDCVTIQEKKKFPTQQLLIFFPVFTISCEIPCKSALFDFEYNT